MKKIFVIGGGEPQVPIIENAKKMGFETHVFDWDQDAPGKDMADHFYCISTRDKNKILQIAIRIKPDGIITNSEIAIPASNYIANELNLIGNSNYSAEVSTDKYKMRKILLNNDLPCPKFLLVGPEEHFNNNFDDLNFPLIVKPVDRSASRGVSKVKNVEELNKAIKEAVDISFTNKAIVEEFIPGKEYSIEMISQDGEHHFLNTTEKILSNIFVEKIHFQPAMIDKELEKQIIKIIKKSLDVLQVKFGASHSEIKINNDEITIIEIGARMGGGGIGSYLVKLSTGFDFVKNAINVAMGLPIDDTELKKADKASLINWIYHRRELEILDEIEKNYPDKLIMVKNLEKINDKEMKDNTDRNAYYILQAETNRECLKMIGYDDYI